MSLLNDDELRAAAATRPGYATYPQYRPGQTERLAPHWRDRDRDREAWAEADTVPLPPAPEGFYPPEAVPLPVEPAKTSADTLAELTQAPVFEFAPRLCPVRPWWRPRWGWTVMASAGRSWWGYCWTESGARRRTARVARRAAR